MTTDNAAETNEAPLSAEAAAAAHANRGPDIEPERLDPDAVRVLLRLRQHGHEAYLVGGCVRDLLIGRKPKDFDVATSATPTQTRAIFRNCRIIGRRFRLAHVFFGTKIIETSTFRANPREPEPVDENATPEELPEGVTVTEDNNELLIRHDNVFGTAEEDARRRDFTMNGLFYDVDENKVIDYVDGLPDIERRLVRTIGDPDVRFREDPVRILRAIKFASRLDFTIEDTAYEAILKHRGEIAKCAAPRVLEEIYRLLREGAGHSALRKLEETGVLKVLMPTLARRLGDVPEERAVMARTLGVLDEHVADGLVPSNALVLGVMLAPFCADILYDDDETRGFDLDALETRIVPLLADVRPSRRDSETLRQILIAQRRLLPPKNRRQPRRSGGRTASLVRREWFNDALLLFELMHPGSGDEVQEELARWRRLARESTISPSQSGAAPVASATTDGGDDEPETTMVDSDPTAPRRRRRRRGGRRRRVPGDAPAS